MTEPVLLVEVADGVARVTLNRPRCAMRSTRPCCASSNPPCAGSRTIRPRGSSSCAAGDRAFCAGADLKKVADRGTTLQARESFGGLGRILEHMARMRTPVIAQVHGYALAGGCGLAAGRTSWWRRTTRPSGCPRSRSGCSRSSSWRRSSARSDASAGLLMILSGEPVSAREAYEMGLVSRLVPRGELDGAVGALARTLAGYSPTALGLAKEAAAMVPEMEYGAALRYLRELITLVALSDDAREGIAAFFEKRSPRFTGR